MICSSPHTHTIVRGDTLYQLAQHYRTTVGAILHHNPRLRPHNLQIGTPVLICPGSDFPMTKPVPTDCASQLTLINDMRLVWLQHIYWTRLLLISIAERLPDETDTTDRLLENPYDIAQIYSRYYPPAVTKQIADLLTEHLQIGAKLITALRDKQTVQADELNRAWYHNADEMSLAFAALTPHYTYDALRKMFDMHLALTTHEVSMRLQKDYPSDIAAFGQVEKEVLRMADYFSQGLLQTFPQAFS